jgi:two-component system chemotaxis response regulator CheY
MFQEVSIMAYNILIVDDSLPMRAVLKKIIKQSGFQVGRFFEAANGREALDLAEKEWFDVVLSDYNMPVMNGMEFLVELKRNDMFKDVPVIMVTTEKSRKIVREFMEKGAVDYIKKPFTPEDIKEKLNNIMGETVDEEEFDDGNEDLDF